MAVHRISGNMDLVKEFVGIVVEDRFTDGLSLSDVMVTACFLRKFETRRTRQISWVKPEINDVAFPQCPHRAHTGDVVDVNHC